MGTNEIQPLRDTDPLFSKYLQCVKPGHGRVKLEGPHGPQCRGDILRETRLNTEQESRSSNMLDPGSEGSILGELWG
jgi:hypothetical protein